MIFDAFSLEIAFKLRVVGFTVLMYLVCRNVTRIHLLSFSCVACANKYKEADGGEINSYTLFGGEIYTFAKRLFHRLTNSFTMG